MDDYIERTVSAYDDTETYERSTEAMTPVAEVSKFLAYLPESARVLDAGCAYGRDANYISSQGYLVEGIDLSEPMIKRAKTLYPDINFRVADVRATGYEEGTLDGIMSTATLLHLKDEDIVLALTEFWRILKPGGVIAISFKKGEGTNEFVESFSSKGMRFYNFQTIATVEAMLIEIGFEPLEAYYVNEREVYGESGRDLEWLNSYAKKPESST